MRLIDDVLSLAERISDRIFALNGGRLWMAAHMRRGDCKLAPIRSLIWRLTAI